MIDVAFLHPITTNIYKADSTVAHKTDFRTRKKRAVLRRTCHSMQLSRKACFVSAKFSKKVFLTQTNTLQLRRWT